MRKPQLSTSACGHVILGVTDPGKRLIKQDNWFWNDDIQLKIHEKKRPFHKFPVNKTLSKCQIYNKASWEAEETVTLIWAVSNKSLYDKRDRKEDEMNTYFCCSNDKNGNLLSKTDKAWPTDCMKISSRFKRKNLLM